MNLKEQATKRLYTVAADILGTLYQRQFIIDLHDELNNPDFTNIPKDSDWRMYIIGEVRENWHFLDEFGRLLFWIDIMNRMKQKNA